MNRSAVILDKTTLELRVVLAGAVTTNQLDCHCWYYDNPGQTKPSFEDYQGALTRAATNNTTDVTLASAPKLGGVSRNVQYVTVYNRDTVNATVTIKTYDTAATTSFIICKQTLATGETLAITVDGDIYIV
jgi:hypothetical protein